MFPDNWAVYRYSEMIIFTVGLMKDPRPLSEHVYQLLTEEYVQMLLHEVPLTDLYLFQSMYKESTVRLPGSPLHNNYFNHYNHKADDDNKRPIDKTPVYVPSKVYVFSNIEEELEIDHRQDAEIIPCTMGIYESSQV